MRDKSFHEAFNVFQAEVHQVARAKGWYDAPVKTDLEVFMLTVSELGEAAEEIRKGTEPLYYVPGNPKPEGVASELADVILRIVDYAEWRGIDLAKAIILKNEYNKTRPYRHGKKL